MAFRKAKFRQWLRTRTPAADAYRRHVFYECSRRNGLIASPALWMAFKLWQGKRLMVDIAAFAQHCNDAREQARAVMEAWTPSLPNAKKGEPYEAKFRVPVNKFRLRALPDMGLSVTQDPNDPHVCTIAGTPTQAGDFDVVLDYIYEGWHNKMPVPKHTLRLTVNPDPKEMWQDVPSDQSLEYARPDWEYEEVVTSTAKIYAASLRGRSHAHQGQFRDDAFAIGRAAGWQIMAVADGAGSALFARKGAALACNVAVDACAESLTRSNDLGAHLSEVNPIGTEWQVQARKYAYNVLATAAFEAHKAIRKEADAKDRESRDYSTTLLLAAARKLSHGWAVCTFQVGDGAIALIHGGGGRLMGIPDEGEFGGQTRFVTMSDIFDPSGLMGRLNVAINSNIKGVLLLTDGITDPRFGTRNALETPANWKQLWEELTSLSTEPEPEAATRQWLEFWAKGSHDDRTFILMQVTDDSQA